MTGRRPRAVFIALATATGILVSAHSAVAALNFFPARSFTAGGLPFDIVAGDLDHDGIADLATTDESGGKVFVLRGNGDGTFQAAQGYTTGAGAEGITLANLRVLFPDQRPELDIVAANLNAGTLSVLKNQGDGTFENPSSIASHLSPEGVTTAYLHDDPLPDVAFVASGTNELGVLSNDHNAPPGGPYGTLSGPAYYATGKEPSAVAAGDFDGDFVDDLVTANTGADNVSLLINLGDGSLTAKKDYDVGMRPLDLATGDFNGDGATDVATANNGSSDVSVLLGNGNGTLQPATQEYLGQAPAGIAVADMNQDGKLDIATANSGDNTVSILLGKGNGQFASPMTMPGHGAAAGLAIADLNNDGAPDLVLAGFSTGDVAVLLAAPQFGVSPASLRSPPRELGIEGPVKTVTIRNQATGALRIRQLIVAGVAQGDFAVASSTCGTTLALGKTCAVGIRFTPLTAGIRRAQLRIVDNAPGSPHRVALTGVGASARGPHISGFRATPQRFRASSKQRTAKVPTATRFRFSLSEPAMFRISLFRLEAGHRNGRHCAPGSTSNPKLRCRARHGAGQLKGSGRQGANSVQFTGRLHGHALKPGQYSASLRATGLTGRRSRPVRAPFSIVAH
ncbi:MAG: choice-of-anchor D domain-containing protein [Actinobacteria bacterium]|nr:MAG: choice-of-anchor D domain-containing protein [Actinomycetota bacterium]